MSNIHALIIVDMQNYYLSDQSAYFNYFNSHEEGCLDYIINRCKDIVTPNIQKLKNLYRDLSQPVIYLRLCGNKKDRSDLHRFFKKTNEITDAR